MADLEQLRQEAENLRKKIRVRTRKTQTRFGRVPSAWGSARAACLIRVWGQF